MLPGVGGGVVDQAETASPVIAAHPLAPIGARSPFGRHPFERPALAHQLLLHLRLLEHCGGIIVMPVMSDKVARPVYRQRPAVHHDTY